MERTWIRDDVTEKQHAEAGPIEFLEFIDNAEYVFTNSFHGTVFSILFHKQFFSVYNDGQNNRIDNLLKLLDLEERHLVELLPETNDSINWENVDLRLNDAQKESKSFLQDALA